MQSADRALLVMLAGVLIVGLAAGVPELSAQGAVKLDGYAEWKPENDVQQGTAQLEGAWLQSGSALEADQQGHKTVIGEIEKDGRHVRRAPDVWGRFLEKYGEQDRMTNFFSSDHSLATARRKNLQREIELNYAR